MSELQLWTYIMVGISLGLYLAIAIWTRAGTTSEFYVAGKEISPVANGMATAADWMSAASFISMAGIVAFNGYSGSAYLMGWTGGFVLLTLLIVPYLKQWGEFTIPSFIGKRYESPLARIVAVICLLVISLTYVVGQMNGVGVTFSHFLGISLENGIMIGVVIMFAYTVLGGMKGITYTQIAQYVVLIFAYTLPAIFISIQLTGHFLPQVGLGSTLLNQDTYLLTQLDNIITDLGFKAYSDTQVNKLNMMLLTLTLMVGTAGLPHMLMRFFTVKTMSQVRFSAAWALVFIAILYTTIPALGVMTRYNITTTVQTATPAGKPEANLVADDRPMWMHNWENSSLLQLTDHNNDGRIQYYNDQGLSAADYHFNHLPTAVSNTVKDAAYQQFIKTQALHASTPFAQYGWEGNELKMHNDILVLASPEIAKLPTWLMALVAAGAIAAALSTAAGLLLTIAAAISHDLVKATFAPQITEQQELMIGRIAMTSAILLAGYWGFNPPGFTAQVVALAFGLAAASFFPVLLLGIFSIRINKWGAILGMLTGMVSTLLYIFWFKGWFFVANTAMAPNNDAYWWWGIAPEAFGVIGAILNLVVALIVSALTAHPSTDMQQLIKQTRVPQSLTSPNH